jgi:hypothetical protein
MGKILEFPHDTTTPLRMIYWGDKPQWKAQFEIVPGKAYECPHTHWDEKEAMRCLTDQERLLRTVTEKEWTADVVKMMRTTHWLMCHFRTGMMVNGRWITPMQGDDGFPDIIGLKGPRILVAELKRQIGYPVKPEQQRWLDAFHAAGAEAYVWRPGDHTLVWAILNGVRLDRAEPIAVEF